MKVKVIGAGAIGSLVGGLLSLKGIDVYFSGNPQNADRIEYLRKNKLRIILPSKWIKAEDFNTGNSDNADMVFITVRKNNYADLLKSEYLPKGEGETNHVILFNGIKSDFESLFQEGVTVTECLTLLSAVMLQPGDVELCSKDACLIFKKDKGLKKILSLLKFYGIKSIQVDDIEPYYNSFFITQLSALPVAMCNTTLNNFLSYQEGRDLITNVLKEGIKTFDRSKRKLVKLPVMDPLELLLKIEKKPEQFTPYRYLPDRSYNSLLQSLLLGRNPEHSNVNAELIKQAAVVGVDTVWNWKLVQKLSKVAKTGFFSNPWELLKGIE